MRIPKRFKLLGKTIDVVINDDLLYEEDYHGTANYRTHEIHIQSKSKTTKIPDDMMGEHFYHELVHWLLYCSKKKLGDEYLHMDEDFVSVLSGLLHQALTTMEYEESNDEHYRSRK